MDTLSLILGSVLAMGGGIIANIVQAKMTRRIRMDEIIAEKKVDTDSKAYRDMKEIESMLTMDMPCLEISNRMRSQEEWFFSHRLFLPGEFPAKWLSLRNNLLAIYEKYRPEESSMRADKFSKAILLMTVTEAIDEIY